MTVICTVFCRQSLSTLCKKYTNSANSNQSGHSVCKTLRPMFKLYKYYHGQLKLKSLKILTFRQIHLPIMIIMTLMSMIFLSVEHLIKWLIDNHNTNKFKKWQRKHKMIDTKGYHEPLN